MTILRPTLLWESADADVVLAQRFRFGSGEEAARWLVDTLLRTYGIRVASVDRLVISSHNLLAWLTSAHGPLIAKCCGLVSAHQRLLNSVELVCWLEQAGLPVSPPLGTKMGEMQVICDHLSLGLRRLVHGHHLDPNQIVQAQTAGMTLARLHNALAVYPRASDFATQSPIPRLDELIHTWVENRLHLFDDSRLIAAGEVIRGRLESCRQLNLATQVVHNDYRSANILWHKGRIAAVLDFEELRWGYCINDLAWAAVHLGTRFRQWGPVSAGVHRVFCAGYELVRPFSPAEQAWLPRLMTWA